MGGLPRQQVHLPLRGRGGGGGWCSQHVGVGLEAVSAAQLLRGLLALLQQLELEKKVAIIAGPTRCGKREISQDGPKRSERPHLPPPLSSWAVEGAGAGPAGWAARAAPQELGEGGREGGRE